MCSACCYLTVRCADYEQGQPKYMHIISMLVSFLELDLNLQVDEQFGGDLAGSQALTEALSINQVRLFLITTKHMAH